MGTDRFELDDIYCWIEQGTSIHLKAVTTHGDPVELTADQAIALGMKLAEMGKK